MPINTIIDSLGFDRALSVDSECKEISEDKFIVLNQVRRFGVDAVYFSTDENGNSFPAVFLKKINSFNSSTLKEIANTHKKTWNYKKVLFLYVYSETEIEAYHVLINEEIVQLDWYENDISQELCEKLECNPKRLEWFISATREYHIPTISVKKKGYADKLARIDIKMTSIVHRQEFKYFFEAKRLKEKDSSLKRNYIDEGMGRFISKKYPSGCMLGFLFQGDVIKTVMGINKLLTKDNRKTEIIVSKQNVLHDYYFESEHFVIGRLKHLILDFSKIKSN